MVILGINLTMMLRKWISIALAGFVASAAQSLVYAQETPDALVKRVVDDVTAALKSDRTIQADRSKINALVDAKIAPSINFARMTQSAVGRHWQRATPEQQTALTREFKSLLTNTYAYAFVEYKPDTVIEYRPFRMQAGETDAVVKSLIKAGGSREPIQIDYYLEKGDSGWKVVDMNVLGARLVETYKNTFNTEINNGGVDGLIKSLGVKNRSIEARNTT